ncbi:hypothetical protein H4R18_001073 [Coemansia javaensis]|uniref:Acyltransferase n=1 Tax=Coemansia javaensis TaxID=2761396 RepID=A0A9W8LKT5_9FUNG|nr:hypothetical protein H4R18_001073 [Coemansia javaensis]
MDSFLKNVKSQTFALCGWDTVVALVNIPFTYYFKNTNADPGAPFMPSGMLRASFLRALQEFPIFAGHLVFNSAGRGFVVVDKDNLNMPEYIESQSQVHYRFLEAARFSWDAVPHEVVTVNTCTTRGKSGIIKLLNVHVVRLRNNSGLILFVSTPHYIVDGVGYTEFMTRWAELCRWMASGSVAEPPSRDCIFDRRAIVRALPDAEEDIGPTASRIYKARSLLGHFIASLSPESLGDFLAEGLRMIPSEAHTFYISREAIEILRAQAYARCADSPRLSDNDIITALTSHVVAKGIRTDAERPENQGLWTRAKRAAARAILGNAGEFMTMVIADIRPRLKKLGEARYAGGSVSGFPVFHPMDELARGTDFYGMLAAAGGRIRACVNGLTAPYIRGINRVLDEDPKMYAHAWAQIMMRPQTLLITNQTRFGLYGCDFGAGAPRWVGGMPTFATNMACILPMDHPSDGYNVYLSAEKQIMRCVLEDEVWAAHTRFVN